MLLQLFNAGNVNYDVEQYFGNPQVYALLTVNKDCGCILSVRIGTGAPLSSLNQIPNLGLGCELANCPNSAASFRMLSHDHIDTNIGESRHVNQRAILWTLQPAIVCHAFAGRSAQSP